MLPQTSVPTYLVEEKAGTLVRRTGPNKIGLPVGVRGIPTTPDGARGKPGAFAAGGDQPACSNPSNSPRLVNCSPQKLESYLFGMVLPSDQLPKMQRSATEKPKVEPTDV